MAKGKYEYWLTKEGLLLLEGWARDGLTDEQIAKNIGISRKTLIEWKQKYSDICDTLKKGKEVVDREVENALFKRARGFDYTEVTEERIYDRATGEYKMTITKSVRKHMAPDVAAVIFWLKNRKPAEWREKVTEIQTGAAGDDGFIDALNATAKEDWEDEAT